MMQIEANVKKLYFDGQYQQIIHHHMQKDLNQSLLPYLCGSYFMLGEFEQAEIFIKATKWNDDEKIIVYSFWIMALLRKSRIDSARELLIKAYRFKIDKKHLKFYLYQAFAFYRYVTGEYKRSLWLGKKALSCLRINDYEKIYALDLIGHAQIQRKNFFSGIHSLDNAIKESIRLKCENLKKSIELSKLGYELENGVELQKNLKLAKEILANYKIEEYYLKGQIQLQMAKGHLLKGELTKMQEILNKCSYNIYKTLNDKQAIQLNLNLAIYNSLAGNQGQALFHINNSKSYLAQFSEKNITDISKNIAQTEEFIISKDLSLIDFESGPFSKEIKNINFKAIPKTDDILKIDRIKQLGLINFFSPLRNKKSIFIISNKQQFLIQNSGDIFWTSKKLTKFQRHFLLTIFELRSLTKKEIIERLWGYSYDPIRHDYLIYNTISRILRVESRLRDIIVMDDNIYIAKEFQVINEKRVSSNKKTIELVKLEKDKVEVNFKYVDLNYRQISTLQHLKTHEHLSPSEYQKMNNISRITATRDLSDLVKRGHMKSIGKTRSIRYIKV